MTSRTGPLTETTFFLPMLSTCRGLADEWNAPSDCLFYGSQPPGRWRRMGYCRPVWLGLKLKISEAAARGAGGQNRRDPREPRQCRGGNGFFNSPRLRLQKYLASSPCQIFCPALPWRSLALLGKNSSRASAHWPWELERTISILMTVERRNHVIVSTVCETAIWN
jgi:hypothetical protein